MLLKERQKRNQTNGDVKHIGLTQRRAEPNNLHQFTVL